MDGFRRLERTRTVATPSEAIAATATFDERVDAHRARRRTARRFAGAARLLTLVAVLAIIIGSSVSLASSNGSDRTPAARDSATTSTGSDAGSADDTTATPDEVDDTASEPVARTAAKSSDSTGTAAEPTPAVAAARVAPTGNAASSTPSGALPFTDSVDMQRLLLGGSLLVLLGMLIQAAGAPLPARARR